MDRKAVTPTEDLSSRGATEALALRHGLVGATPGAPQRVAASGADPASMQATEPRVWNALDFDQVYDVHFDFVWRSLHLLGISPESIEDAVQDTFSVVARQLSRFEGRSALRTWIFAILQRVALNYRRTRKRKLHQLTPFADAAGNEPTPQAHAEAAEAAQLIERFCRALAPDRRALFVLAVLEETPAAEVATTLGLPIGTVYSRVHALREGLRRVLAAQEVERG